MADTPPQSSQGPQPWEQWANQMGQGGGWTQLSDAFRIGYAKDHPYQGGSPSAGDPMGTGETQQNPVWRAQQLNTLGGSIGGMFNKIGQGIDPFTGKPYDTGDPNSAAGRAYSQAAAPIESGFYKGGHDVASYLARQGLGSSGINIGASQQLANNKESLESQARLKSIDLAQAQSTQSLLNNLSSQLMGAQPNFALFMQQQQINAQMQALQEQLDAQMMSGLGQGIGSGLGMGLSKYA